MTGDKIKVDVRYVGKQVGILDIQGEITGSAETILTDAYNQLGTDIPAIILNFTALDYMNSSGIGLLVTLLIRSRRHGQRLLAVGLTEHYQEIFELTRLNEVILLYASEADALTALQIHTS